MDSIVHDDRSDNRDDRISHHSDDSSDPDADQDQRSTPSDKGSSGLVGIRIPLKTSHQDLEIDSTTDAILSHKPWVVLATDMPDIGLPHVGWFADLRNECAGYLSRHGQSIWESTHYLFISAAAGREAPALAKYRADRNCVETERQKTGLSYVPSSSTASELASVTWTYFLISLCYTWLIAGWGMRKSS